MIPDFPQIGKFCLGTLSFCFGPNFPHSCSADRFVRSSVSRYAVGRSVSTARRATPHHAAKLDLDPPSFLGRDHPTRNRAAPEADRAHRRGDFLQIPRPPRPTTEALRRDRRDDFGGRTHYQNPSGSEFRTSPYGLRTAVGVWPSTIAGTSRRSRDSTVDTASTFALGYSAASTADTATPNAARSLIRGRVAARARSRRTRARPFLRSTWPT